jgi:hypothetical protein
MNIYHGLECYLKGHFRFVSTEGLGNVDKVWTLFSAKLRRI